MSDLLESYISSLQALTVDRLDDFMMLVNREIHFRDPFNDCYGRQRYRAVLADMFEKLDAITFTVQYYGWATGSSSQAQPTALMQWALSARLKRAPWRIEGCSEVRFDDDGLVVAHYDYWDAAAGLYERLPLLGRVLGHIRRRIGVG